MPELSIRSQKQPIGSQTADFFLKFSIMKLSMSKKGGKGNEAAFLENGSGACAGCRRAQPFDNFTMGLVSAGRRLTWQFTTSGEKNREMFAGVMKEA